MFFLSYFVRFLWTSDAACGFNIMEHHLLRECSMWPFDSYIRRSLDRYGRAHCLAGTLTWPDLPRFLFVRLHEVNGSWNRYWPWRRSCSTHCQRSSWNRENPWHLWKGTRKYGTSMHCLSGSQWTCVPAIVAMGQKTGSILTMQHWSEQVFSYIFFFRMKYALFSACRLSIWINTENYVTQNDLLFAHTYFLPSLPLRHSCTEMKRRSP